MLVHIIQLDTIGQLYSSERFKTLSDLCIAAWQQRFECRVWKNADLASLPLTEKAIPFCKSLAAVADVMRLEILALHGGLYVDADTYPLQMPESLNGLVLCCEDPSTGLLSNAFIHAPKAVLQPIAEQCSERAKLALPPNEATGPRFLTWALQNYEKTIVEASLCFPIIWGKTSAESLLDRAKAGEFPTSWLAHLWIASWK